MEAKTKKTSELNPEYPALQTISLTKRFGKFTAVDNINVKVEKGTVHGFIGPNGAGKTTTIKCLIGAFRPTQGKTEILGQKSGTVKANLKLGYIPEKSLFPKHVTVYNYLQMAAELSRLKPAAAKKKIDEILQQLEITFLKKKIAFALSSGQKKKVLLAQALLNSPEVLILDEPAANLDPTARIELLSTLSNLARTSGTTVFISSHILSELQQVVDNITILNKGKILYQGKLQLESDNLYEIGTNNDSKMKQILKENGVEIVEAERNLITKQSTPGIVFKLDKKKDLNFVLSLAIANSLSVIKWGPFENSLEGIYSNLVMDEGTKN